MGGDFAVLSVTDFSKVLIWCNWVDDFVNFLLLLLFAPPALPSLHFCNWHWSALGCNFMEAKSSCSIIVECVHVYERHKATPELRLLLNILLCSALHKGQCRQWKTMMALIYNIYPLDFSYIYHVGFVLFLSLILFTASAPKLMDLFYSWSHFYHYAVNRHFNRYSATVIYLPRLHCGVEQIVVFGNIRENLYQLWISDLC